MPGPQVIPRPTGWRPGGPAPWAHLSPAERRGLDVERVRRAVATDGPTHDEPHPLELDLTRLRPAAVLVAVFDEPVDGTTESHVVLTRRAATLRSHTHQVSFPGGRIDPDETGWDAARREAFEEVALPFDASTQLGLLPPLATFAGGSAVAPFVASLATRPTLVASEAEVERAFTVSLAELVADGCHHEERWDLPGLPDRAIHFFDLDEDLVWGATARILVGLLARVLGVADPNDPSLPG